MSTSPNEDNVALVTDRLWRAYESAETTNRRIRDITGALLAGVTAAYGLFAVEVGKNCQCVEAFWFFLGSMFALLACFVLAGFILYPWKSGFPSVKSYDELYVDLIDATRADAIAHNISDLCKAVELERKETPRANCLLLCFLVSSALALLLLFLGFICG